MKAQDFYYFVNSMILERRSLWAIKVLRTEKKENQNLKRSKIIVRAFEEPLIP
jgi:hypothetical protein